VNRFCEGMGGLLDSEWDLIYGLTYNTVGNSKNIDTGRFRRAIWYYTFRLYGMCHDDYDYKEIPVFLQQSVKQFVKKVACDPESATASDYVIKGYQFSHDEKCHIALLAMEGHRQVIIH
jgi:hypothetical protein